jgi:AcrR family transcriptional regulator
VSSSVNSSGPAPDRTSQARTRLARRAVVDAARQLFLECGYAATTVEAISAHSDVPPATIYRLFPGKLGILRALLDVSIAGDDQELTLQGRAEVTALFAEPDPGKLLAGFAAINVAINTRSTEVYRILVSASGSDPEAAALLANYTRMRDQGQELIAAALVRARALQPGMRERDAADIIHALMSPELYRLLVIDRGWTPARYDKWLTSTLVERLLGPR